MAAVEELTAAGVNVNITLLFSVSRYEEVALAYLRGLERLGAGAPIGDIAPVASFLVSRVDTAVDALLPEESPLRGRVAIANAKMAYRRFREIFSGERWERLAAGATLHRPLWVDRHEEPRLLRRPLRRGARRPRPCQHDAQGHPRRLPGPWQGPTRRRGGAGRGSGIDHRVAVRSWHRPGCDHRQAGGGRTGSAPSRPTWRSSCP